MALAPLVIRWGPDRRKWKLIWLHGPSCSFYNKANWVIERAPAAPLSATSKGYGAKRDVYFGQRYSKSQGWGVLLFLPWDLRAPGDAGAADVGSALGPAPGCVCAFT